MDKSQFIKEIERIYKQNFKKFVHYFVKKYGLTGHSFSDFEDFVAEGFYKAIENWELYDETKASLETWLFKVIDNHIKDKLKSKSSKILPQLKEFSSTLSSSYESPENIVFKKQLFNIFVREIQKLPTSQRDVLILYFFIGVEEQHISYLLNVSINAVRANKSRGIKRIKERIQKLDITLGDTVPSEIDFQLTQEEVAYIITDELTRNIYIDYFFNNQDVETVMEIYQITEDEFLKAILEGLNMIAIANIQRKKEKGKKMSEATFKELGNLLFKEIFLYNLLEKLNEQEKI